MKNNNTLIHRFITGSILAALAVTAYTQLSTHAVSFIIGLIACYALVVEWPQFNNCYLLPFYPLASMLCIIIMNEETILLPFIVIIVASTDTIAYCIGRLWGKYLLAPAISPKKTWEGFIAGLLGGSSIGLLLAPYFTISLDIKTIVFVILISCMATLGDLFESYLKRRSHIKDSGSLLPGHGGVLDRIDSLLFAAPAGYFFYKVFGL